MGEYALYNGAEIKIGTCDEMYYLRADQANKVRPLSGNVNPIRDIAEIRFRFPFPGEDKIAPGEFEDHDKGYRIDGLAAPAELAEHHDKIQFVAQYHGYNVCLPCPESGKPAPEGIKIHRNGFRGATFLCQQVYHGGFLAGVMRCTCGMKWRLPTLEDAQPALDALEAMAKSEDHRHWLAEQHHKEKLHNPADGIREVAHRLAQGYDREHVENLLVLPYVGASR